MERLLNSAGLQDLINLVQRAGYQVLGPTVRDGAIILDEISGIMDLPIGIKDIQEAGQYRLQKRDDHALFGYVVGPQSFKKYLHPPKEKLWSIHKSKDGWNIQDDDITPKKMAFLGIRSCELHAIAIQDRVLIKGSYKDQGYEARRKDLLMIAVNCTEPAATCFCTSMETGPVAKDGYDLSLTEIIKGGQSSFLARAATIKGKEILDQVPGVEVTRDHLDIEKSLFENATAAIKRQLPASEVKELLAHNLDHPHWDKVAERCLSCANCTFVCPTCFCTTVEDVTDLNGDVAERWQSWDSCFTLDYSYIHGGSVRKSGKSRYRQWLTHKLSTWHDQFGSSGCVGCGRCVTWCPVGIDLTEEVKAFQSESISK